MTARRIYVLRRDLKHVARALSGPPPNRKYYLALLDRQRRWREELRRLEDEAQV